MIRKEKDRDRGSKKHIHIVNVWTADTSLSVSRGNFIAVTHLFLVLVPYLVLQGNA